MTVDPLRGKDRFPNRQELMRRFFTPSKESAAHTIINPPKEGERAAGGRILPPRTSKDWWQARENHLRVMNSRRPN